MTCPPVNLLNEEQLCKECVTRTSDWSTCTGNKQYRTNEIITPAKGTFTCPPIKEREEQECSECVYTEGTWSDCQKDEQTRMRWNITKDAKGTFTCPPNVEEKQNC